MEFHTPTSFHFHKWTILNWSSTTIGAPLQLELQLHTPCCISPIPFHKVLELEMEGIIWNGAPSIPIPCVEMEFQMCNSRCGVELHTWNCVALRALRAVRTSIELCTVHIILYVKSMELRTVHIFIRRSMELRTVHIILYVNPWNCVLYIIIYT